MNCCDEYGDCRQGRECPARKAPSCRHCYGTGYDASGYPCTCVPADVAKVGRRMPKTPKPLRHPFVNVHLKHLAKAMLLMLAVMLVSALTVGVMR